MESRTQFLNCELRKNAKHNRNIPQSFYSKEQNKHMGPLPFYNYQNKQQPGKHLFLVVKEALQRATSAANDLKKVSGCMQM